MNIKESKAISLLLCLVAICANSFSAFAKTAPSNHITALGHTWSKQQLLNAGFKSTPYWKNILPSEVIFGGKNGSSRKGGAWISQKVLN